MYDKANARGTDGLGSWSSCSPALPLGPGLHASTFNLPAQGPMLLHITQVDL
jgi:hypothetical protein